MILYSIVCIPFSLVCSTKVKKKKNLNFPFFTISAFHAMQTLFFFGIVFATVEFSLLSETTYLSSQDRGKVYVYSTFLRSHSWNYTGYIVVVDVVLVHLHEKVYYFTKLIFWFSRIAINIYSIPAHQLHRRKCTTKEVRPMPNLVINASGVNIMFFSFVVVVTVIYLTLPLHIISFFHGMQL